MTIHLQSIGLKAFKESTDSFPFNLPLVQNWHDIQLQSPVTILVGENGSGKSTFMETLACAIDITVVGGEPLSKDPSLKQIRDLARYVNLGWNIKHPHRGFFLRAEDFFNFTKRIAQTVHEMDELTADFSSRFSGYGRMLATGAVEAEKAEMLERYDGDLDANSHGESFLKLFQSRLVPGGLYILDEPEAPLSPQRQLSLIALIKDMVLNQNAQFIIATHSPILMSFPDAHIYCFDTIPPQLTAFDEVEHVDLMRKFLANPEAYLRHL